MQNLGLSVFPKWHFAVAKGYDLDKKELILNSGTLENYRVSLETFERTWARSDYWGIVVPAPGEIPVTAAAKPWFTALSDLEYNQPAGAMLNAYYDSALDRWPTDANLLMGYGNLLYSQQKLAEAQQVFSQMTLLQEDYAPAYNTLAWIQFELEDYASALKNAERAVALGGEHSGSYEDTYQQIADKMKVQ
jgi:tetratricopeptide (TPR) repeat protein